MNPATPMATALRVKSGVSTRHATASPSATRRIGSKMSRLYWTCQKDPHTNSAEIRPAGRPKRDLAASHANKTVAVPTEAAGSLAAQTDGPNTQVDKPVSTHQTGHSGGLWCSAISGI